ncbi:hypothetical protein SGGMMB4_03158 [Sodalis glossinidius str. 'morsitans']|uniref:Uncharacterized protein n=1 Tax=Sodalis glossinidius (strain morsitans) TaxID=343509 RepID=A0A193QJT5_SODGM|nr:hypothetical protein SGGMMB4_03158 [Sodalis glossinidius str. 'morsitans']
MSQNPVLPSSLYGINEFVGEMSSTALRLYPPPLFAEMVKNVQKNQEIYHPPITQERNKEIYYYISDYLFIGCFTHFRLHVRFMRINE